MPRYFSYGRGGIIPARSTRRRDNCRTPELSARRCRAFYFFPPIFFFFCFFLNFFIHFYGYPVITTLSQNCCCPRGRVPIAFAMCALRFSLQTSAIAYRPSMHWRTSKFPDGDSPRVPAKYLPVTKWRSWRASGAWAPSSGTQTSCSASTYAGTPCAPIASKWRSWKVNIANSRSSIGNKINIKLTTPVIIGAFANVKVSRRCHLVVSYWYGVKRNIVTWRRVVKYKWVNGMENFASIKVTGLRGPYSLIFEIDCATGVRFRFPTKKKKIQKY